MCRIIGAAVGFPKPNIASGHRDERVAVPSREGDVAVVAGRVDVEVVGTDEGIPDEGGALTSVSGFGD